MRESSTATPNQPVPDSVFLPAELFPPPLAWTWSATKGADLSWVPIAFERSFRMGYSRTCYGTGYYIYHQWVPGTKLSQSLRAWDGKTPPDKDVLELIQRAGTDLLPAPGSPEAQRLRLAEQHGKVTVPRTGTVMVQALAQAPAMLRALEMLLKREPRAPDWETDLRGGLRVISERAAALSRFMKDYARLARLPSPSLQPVELAPLVRTTAAWLVTISSCETLIAVVAWQFSQ